ncbi:MAG TPA: methionyl-tRNA formyltransferase [Bacilli bacterium]|nr:methionyl-tRNA formyltransferase [Bacilli bacterium]
MENLKKLRYVYMGSPAMSAEFLTHLINENFNIIAVISNPARKVGRKQTVEHTDVSKVAQAHNIPLFTPINIKNDYEFFLHLDVDVILTFAYGQIVPLEVLNHAKIIALNYHGSILPKYRGASPIQHALINGDKLTGVSLMRMVEKMDAGEVYGVKMFPIFPEDNYATLSNKTVFAAKCVTNEVLKDVVTLKNKGVPQDETKVTFTKLLKKDDFKLSINDPLVNFLGKIRAFSPEPGAVYTYNNLHLKILKAAFYKEKHVAPIGELFVVEREGLFLQHSVGVIKLLTVQKPGKNALDGLSYTHGERTLRKINL